METNFFSECEQTDWMEDWNFKKAYRQFNSPTLVGNMSYLYNKYDRPSTTREFYERYISDTTADVPPQERGRSEEELMRFAEQYKNNYDSNVSYPVDLFYKNLVYHFFTQTINGHQAEEEFMNTVNARSTTYKVTAVDYMLDTKYGVDLCVTKGDETFYVQIKPISFIAGKNPSESLRQDRMSCYRKRKAILDDYGCNTKYAFYRDNNGHREWLIRGGKILSELEDVLDKNGNSLYRYDTSKWKEF